MYQTTVRERKSEKDSVFRDYEKKYRIPSDSSKATDFLSVIDFTNIENNSEENKRLIKEVEVNTQIWNQNGGNSSAKPIKAYTIANLEGLYFIPNPFTPEEQRYWIKRCVKDFTVGNPTNISNLERQTDPDYPLWSEWKPEYKKALRWSTLGYHFQWTPRKYLDEFKGDFPEDLRDLIVRLASALNYEMTPEAATLNYYPISKQSMCAHLDDAEDDMTKPIVSVSFGSTVVFLIGGRTRDIVPTAFFIRSGDVVLMGGESRYCYHGVPRMLQSSSPDYLSKEKSPEDWLDCANYIEDARINMNCRQVRLKKEEAQ